MFLLEKAVAIPLALLLWSSSHAASCYSVHDQSLLRHSLESELPHSCSSEVEDESNLGVRGVVRLSRVVGLHSVAQLDHLVDNAGLYV